MLKNILHRIVPRSVFRAYHAMLARFGARRYGFPSRRLLVIGVTGTTGKSTVIEMLAAIFMAAGKKVGSTSTVRFRVGERTWMNDRKMTMLGRSAIQKLLADMVRQRCDVAIIETTSEGIAQSRHVGIAYDAAVFTNLTPEHIESHGSFDAYKAAKMKLFAGLARQPRKPNVPKAIVANADDAHAEAFLSCPADVTVRVHLRDAERCVTDAHGSAFVFHGAAFHLPLPGDYNVMNALLAAETAHVYGVPYETAAAALRTFSSLPGRFQRIEGRGITAFVDYAHEPAGLEALYRNVRAMEPRRLIAVLGAAGGGRDTWKRPVLGGLAAKYADIVVVTNEDPYDEDVRIIIDAVADGAQKGGKEEGKTLFRIEDRLEALQKAASLAQPGDILVVSGKGSESVIMGKNGSRTPWNDAETIEKLLKT